MSPDETVVRALYHQLLDAWSRRDADAFAGLIAEDGEVIGFDGSDMLGPATVASALRTIFESHATGRYVSSVRGVRLVAPDVAVVRAVAGLVPPGSDELVTSTCALQRLVAVRRDGAWTIVLFQNTPAQFHGRTDDARALHDELRQLIQPA